MIYANDPLFKVSYACHTNDQSHVEAFIMLLGRNYHGDKNSIYLFQTPIKNAQVVHVYVKISKTTRRRMFRMAE